MGKIDTYTYVSEIINLIFTTRGNIFRVTSVMYIPLKRTDFGTKPHAFIPIPLIN